MACITCNILLVILIITCLIGWQEPGFWRSKWVMEREFDSEEDAKLYPAKIYFKMKNDKSIKIFNTKQRPRFELFKPKKTIEKKKKLFETGDEKVVTAEEHYATRKSDPIEQPIDGAWTWADAAPLNQAKVTIETIEGESKDKIRHDCRCDWGKLDGYAPLFRPGKIVKYKLTPGGLPVGQYIAGSFTIKVSPHRPLLSKEFLAFQ